jgi:hypothetical protein
MIVVDTEGFRILNSITMFAIVFDEVECIRLLGSYKARAKQARGRWGGGYRQESSIIWG